MKVKHGGAGAGLKKWPYLFFAPFLIFYISFSLYPIAFSFFISFTDWAGIRIQERSWVGLANYVKILKDPFFFKSLFNIFRIMIFAIPITIAAGLLMAVLVFSIRKFRRTVQTLNFLPYITTSVAVGIIFAYIFDWNMGSVNRLLSALGIIKENTNWLGNKLYAPWVLILLIVWKNFGYFMVLYLSGLATIPGDLYEAARIDGANSLQRFSRITLPMLQPITNFVIINVVINGLQMFDEAMQLFAGAASGSATVGGPERSVLTPVWYFYDVSFKNNSRYGYGSSIAFSLFLVILAVSAINVLILKRKEHT